MSKIICSWDIGIKNLAYCIIRCDENIKTSQEKEKCWEILKWDIINISEDVEKIKCSLCKKTAVISNFNNEYFCKKHYVEVVITLPENFALELQNSNCKCQNTKCKNKAKFKIDDVPYCTIHKKSFENKYLKSRAPKNIKNTNSNKIPIYDLIKKLFLELENVKTHILNVDEVIIENQPTRLNPTMKTISSAVFSYFVFNGINCKFISPINKLKINKENTNKELDNIEGNKKRIVTKALGIKYTLKLFENHPDNDKYCNILEQYKKKDDLCDSFLQGYHYINKK